MTGVGARSQITREQAQDFRRRWHLLNTAEKDELRSTPPDVKFRQLSALMVLAREMGWDRTSVTVDTSGREIWHRLRQAYGV